MLNKTVYYTNGILLLLQTQKLLAMLEGMYKLEAVGQSLAGRAAQSTTTFSTYAWIEGKKSSKRGNT